METSSKSVPLSDILYAVVGPDDPIKYHLEGISGSIELLTPNITTASESLIKLGRQSTILNEYHIEKLKWNPKTRKYETKGKMES